MSCGKCCVQFSFLRRKVLLYNEKQLRAIFRLPRTKTLNCPYCVKTIVMWIGSGGMSKHIQKCHPRIASKLLFRSLDFKKQCSKCKRAFCNKCIVMQPGQYGYQALSRSGDKSYICASCLVFTSQPMCRSQVERLRISDLKTYLKRHKVSAACIEKNDLVDEVMQHASLSAAVCNCRCNTQTNPLSSYITVGSADPQINVNSDSEETLDAEMSNAPPSEQVEVNSSAENDSESGVEIADLLSNASNGSNVNRTEPVSEKPADLSTSHPAATCSRIDVESEPFEERIVSNNVNTEEQKERVFDANEHSRMDVEPEPFEERIVSNDVNTEEQEEPLFDANEHSRIDVEPEPFEERIVSNDVNIEEQEEPIFNANEHSRIDVEPEPFEERIVSNDVNIEEQEEPLFDANEHSRIDVEPESFEERIVSNDVNTEEQEERAFDANEHSRMDVEPEPFEERIVSNDVNIEEQEGPVFNANEHSRIDVEPEPFEERIFSDDVNTEETRPTGFYFGMVNTEEPRPTGFYFGMVNTEEPRPTGFYFGTVGSSGEEPMFSANEHVSHGANENENSADLNAGEESGNDAEYGPSGASENASYCAEAAGNVEYLSKNVANFFGNLSHPESAGVGSSGGAGEFFPEGFQNCDNASEQPGPSRVRDVIHIKDVDTLEKLEKLSVKQMKQLLYDNRVDFSGCCERAELLDRLTRLWLDVHLCPTNPDNLKPDDLCKICMDAKIDCVMLRCGHMATCLDCGRVQDKCPICRVYVISVLRIFRT